MFQQLNNKNFAFLLFFSEDSLSMRTEKVPIKFLVKSKLCLIHVIITHYHLITARTDKEMKRMKNAIDGLPHRLFNLENKTANYKIVFAITNLLKYLEN